MNMANRSGTLPPHDPVADAYGDTILTFAREPGFLEKGPAAFFYVPDRIPLQRCFTFGEPGDEPAFYEKAQVACDEAKGRSTSLRIYERGMLAGVTFTAMRCSGVPGACPVLLVLYGWQWQDGEAFLLAFARRYDLVVLRDMPKKQSELVQEPVRSVL